MPDAHQRHVRHVLIELALHDRDVQRGIFGFGLQRRGDVPCADRSRCERSCKYLYERCCYGEHVRACVCIWVLSERSGSAGHVHWSARGHCYVDGTVDHLRCLLQRESRHNFVQ